MFFIFGDEMVGEVTISNSQEFLKEENMFSINSELLQLIVQAKFLKYQK